MRILVVSPRFAGSGGGATVYYPLLARAMQARGHEIVVASDASKGAPDGVRVYRLFPAKDRDRNLLRDGLGLILQNIALLLVLPWIARRQRPDVVLLHTSLFRHPGVMPLVLALLRRLVPDAILIGDARDPNMPARRVPLLRRCDAVLACGQRVRGHLERSGLAPDLIHDVRVIQDAIVPTAERAERRRALVPGDAPYVLFAGLLIERKGVGVLIEAFVRHMRIRHPGLRLVLAGPNKLRDPALLALLESEGVVRLGALPHGDVLALIQDAALCVNLSPIEGLPRFSLESMTLGRPCLLPPNIPEFDASAPECVVVAPDDPTAVARQALALMEAGRPCAYPIGDHLPDHVAACYEAVFWGLRPRRSASST